jgi:hypothetical protein
MFKLCVAATTAGLLVAATCTAQAQGTGANGTMASGTGAANCETQAVDKNGTPLAGAAKASSMKKCMKMMAAKECDAKAVDSEGKPLSGAAKKSFVKHCVDSAIK